DRTPTPDPATSIAVQSPTPEKPRQPAPALHPRFVDVPQNIIDTIMSRNVYISTEFGSGSGGRIGNGLVLTARHVVVDKGTDRSRIRILVDHKPATIVAEDKETDIAVLRLLENDGTAHVDISYDQGLIKLNIPVVIAGNPNLHLNTFQTGVICQTN